MGIMSQQVVNQENQEKPDEQGKRQGYAMNFLDDLLSINNNNYNKNNNNNYNNQVSFFLFDS